MPPSDEGGEKTLARFIPVYRVSRATPRSTMPPSDEGGVKNL